MNVDEIVYSVLKVFFLIKSISFLLHWVKTKIKVKLYVQVYQTWEFEDNVDNWRRLNYEVIYFSFEFSRFSYFLYLFVYIFFLLGKYLGVELLSHMVTLCLIVWRTARLFFKAAMPFYTPVNSGWQFQSLHSFANSWYLTFLY